MSQQLRFSAVVSVLTMALFALSMSAGGMKDPAGFTAPTITPHASATLGR